MSKRKECSEAKPAESGWGNYEVNLWSDHPDEANHPNMVDGKDFDDKDEALNAFEYAKTVFRAGRLKEAEYIEFRDSNNTRNDLIAPILKGGVTGSPSRG